jgi:antitoxin component HigA of HigAB toxin-antitoxin module
MPRNTRGYLLRYADQADNDMDRALEKLEKMAQLYHEEHPKYEKACQAIAQAVIMAQENLRDLRDNHM